MDNSFKKDLKVMFGLDLAFLSTYIMPYLLDPRFGKVISVITGMVLLVLAVLNVINVSISIKRKWNSKKNSNEEDN